MTLTRRKGNRPVTGSALPHLQLSDKSPRDVHRHMSHWALIALPATTPELRERPTRISVPSTRALWLDEEVDADPAGFMPPPGNREFAHLHADGSWHLHVDEALVTEILDKGWGERHPWYYRGVLEVMMYAPRDFEEAETVKAVVLESVRHVSRGAVVPFAKQTEPGMEPPRAARQ